MREKRTNLEIIAPTIEEAIEKGLSDLGLPEEAVEVEILDEGSRGLFGIGSRQARVRLTIKNQGESEAALPPKTSQAFKEEAPRAEFPGEADYVLATSRDTVTELLEKMRVRANVTAEYGEPDEIRNRTPVHVNILGDDLSILIGRHAETLNALQYIASLIVSKEIGHSIPLIVDVEGYRSRRESQLRQLARRMADQAIKTGRQQVLEPMPANERRVIHIELRANPQVTTESVGEEPRRKITILPK
ncbi:MAG TPA: RNA-binding cell elongation regulator Jag/EloR [Anaerolineales bacterium]|nr:RNA-binding cell elongation regulator Jag/EloR [Anaerolineales bacterium]